MVSFMFFHQMARWRLLEVFLCKATSCQNFFYENSNLKVTELVARCSVLSTSSSSFSPRSIITSMFATIMSFTWSISDCTLWGKINFISDPTAWFSLTLLSYQGPPLRQNQSLSCWISWFRCKEYRFAVVKLLPRNNRAELGIHGKGNCRVHSLPKLPEELLQHTSQEPEGLATVVSRVWIGQKQLLETNF